MRKNRIVFFAVALVLTGQLFADVAKKTKTEVNFTKFGKFTSIQDIKISELKKATYSDNKFKGKGIMGKLAGKFALKSGKTGEIIDLSEMLTYKLNHKKKEYRVSPIETFSDEEGRGGEGAAIGEEQEESGERESDIRVVRNEFKVDKTGEKKTINQFSCQKYAVSWIVDWENVRTGETGTNRLLTTVWTTPLSGGVKESYDQEMSFSREYMRKIGIDMEAIQQDILGTHWLGLFTQMSDESAGPKQAGSDFAKEMKKIEGYPVIIDGKYYATKQGGDQEQEEEEGGGVKKMLGGFAKKALKKSKKKDSNEPAFSYYTELIELRTANFGDVPYQVPSDYKKKG